MKIKLPEAYSGNNWETMYNRPVRKSVISSQVSQFSQAEALRKLVNSKLMIRKMKFPNISNLVFVTFQKNIYI